MTRKDVEALALALGRHLYNQTSSAGWNQGFYAAMDAVMDVCEMQNGRFSRATFKETVLAAFKDAAA